MKKLLTLCLLIAITFTNYAQDKKPTVKETKEFLDLKLSGKNVWYTSSSKVTTYGCAQRLVYYFNIEGITFQEPFKEMTFSEKESCDDKVPFCVYTLASTKAIETGANGDGYYFVKISSSVPILSVYGKEKIAIENEKMFKLFFSSEEEAKKVEKAFRHLFNLTGVKLITTDF
jgi:hypothetical protein